MSTQTIKGQGVCDVFGNWTSAKMGDAMKSVMYTVDWSKHFGYSSDTANKVRSTAVIGKNLFGGPCELPKKILTIGDTIGTFFEKPSFPNFFQIFLKTNSAVSPAVDTLELGADRGIIHISSDTMRFCKGIGGVSLVIGMTNDTVEAFAKIAEKTGDKHFSDILCAQMIKIAKSISYIVLGVFIVLSIFFDVAVPGLAFLTAATSALVFSILGYFNEEVGQPKLERKKF